MIISAGNDIVDLQTIDPARTRDARFYAKFITGPEAALYSQPQLAHLPFECFVWLLWSVKESVYKFNQRHNPDLVFSPTKIIIEYIAPPLPIAHADVAKAPIQENGFDNQIFYNGIIAFGGHKLYSRSIITSAYISTLVNNVNNFDNIYWGVKSVDDSSPAFQSTAVRQFILKKLAPVLKSAHLNIIKSSTGCPILYDGPAETSTPISLSHHGNYVAYSFHFGGQ